MKKINIKTYRNTLNYFLIISGIVLLILNVAYSIGNLHSLISNVCIISVGVIGELKRRKSYFKFSKNELAWRFPDYKKEKTLQLEGDNYVVSSDWKGIVLKNENNEHSISLDGLWKNDKKHILKQLQEYFN